ncbi:MAG TPA: amino acid ABC transporter permease [Acetobacteraceae bacterium]|nr:amino acid ABC transporter permease [Acetobacteraceae bacterium]
MRALNAIWVSIPSLLLGLAVTLEVSALVVGIGLVLGLLMGAALSFGPRLIAWPVRAVVDVIRGLPILVLIFFVYYVLPAVGLDLGNFAAAVAALTLFSACQVAEIARGALGSVHHGQFEAGRAIGLRFSQVLLWVVGPQAVRRFLPPWLNSVTDAVKGSALVSLVGIVDLMQSIQQVIGRTYEPMPLYLMGAAIYIAINYALSQSSRALEARFRV